MNGRLYFVATNGYTGKGNGRELWTSDGTAAGTVLVKDIVPGSGSSLPDNLTNVNGLLYFTAADGVVHGYELWQSDGTAAGTVMVQDINPGSGGSNPTYLVAMNNKLYFSADDGTHGRELWDPPPVEPSGGSSRLGGGDTSALAGFDVRIADLGGTTLGLASGNTLWLDDAAAGWGWFVDETPGEDSEFTTPGKQGEMHRMDLLTVLMHEIGHVLGYEHSKEGVMAGSLTAGTRHVPPSGPDLFDVAVLDQVFADGKTSLALPFSDGAVL